MFPFFKNNLILKYLQGETQNKTFCFRSVSAKGTVYGTLYQPPRMSKQKSHSGLTKLHKPREPFRTATSVPILPGVKIESHIDIYNRAIDIMIDRLGR